MSRQSRAHRDRRPGSALPPRRRAHSTQATSQRLHDPHWRKRHRPLPPGTRPSIHRALASRQLPRLLFELATHPSRNQHTTLARGRRRVKPPRVRAQRRVAPQIVTRHLQGQVAHRYFLLGDSNFASRVSSNAIVLAIVPASFRSALAGEQRDDSDETRQTSDDERNRCEPTPSSELPTRLL